MISGASEEELILATARADIMLALDNTSAYESWLILDTYIEKIEKENQELRTQQKKFIKHLELTIGGYEVISDLLFSKNKELKVYKEVLSKYKEIIGSDKE